MRASHSTLEGIMDNRSDLWRQVDAASGRLIELSDRIWHMPEV
jgi:aminobenzoyl-glutamate utilization protein B